MTLDVKPDAKYAPYLVEVRKVSDNTVVPFDTFAAGTYTFTMPDDNVTVTVLYEKMRDDLTARVRVLDDGGDPIGNTALLRHEADPQPGVALLTGLKWNDYIALDITVAPGYRVEIVTKTPDGLVILNPNLSTVNSDQTMTFYMPTNRDHVVIEVRFEKKDMYDITLDVVPGSGDSTYDPNNKASISVASGDSAGPINGDDAPVIVKGMQNELTTVTVQAQPGYYAKVTFNPVNAELTHVIMSDGVIHTFNVPGENVDVTVEFLQGPPPAEHNVILHLLDESRTEIDLSVLSATDLNELAVNFAEWVGAVPAAVKTDVANQIMSIPVPQGETVKVHAEGTGHDIYNYVIEAYAKYMGSVLYPVTGSENRNTVALDNGRTVTTDYDFNFIMQQDDDVHVYIVLGDDTFKRTVTLTVEDISGGIVGEAGYAEITQVPKPIKAESNDKPYRPADHSTPVEPGNTFLVSVTVKPGYMIENAVIAPPDVSLSLIEDHTTPNADGTTTYFYELVTMPDASIGVNIVIKKGYKATMVMVNDSPAGTPVGYDDTTTGWQETAGGLKFPTTTHEEKEAFTGQVEVLPGWYIASVRIEGEKTLNNYDALRIFTDGYNNGAGGLAHIDILGQPSEDIKVYITLVKGPPSPDEKYGLTLTVEDDGHHHRNR